MYHLLHLIYIINFTYSVEKVDYMITEKVYEMCKDLGIEKQEVDNIVVMQNTESNIEFPLSSGIYKAGGRYGTIASGELYKAGSRYGTVSPKEL